MAKKLIETKRDYENYIAEYMHKNHISFKTLEQTKQTWRTERAYDATIEAELVSTSKVFMLLLRNDLNMDFRRRLVNFMSNYLAVYVSKSKEYANIVDAAARQERAYVKLNNDFLMWLNSIQTIKKSHKEAIQQKTQKPHKEKTAPKYKKHLFKQDAKIIQEIDFGKEKVIFTYENMAEYRKNYRADFARTIAVHTK